jgi:small-conductance mechanosensitive channel
MFDITDYALGEGRLLLALGISVAGLALTLLVAYYVNRIIKRFISSKAISQPKIFTPLNLMRRLIVYAIILMGVMATTFAAFPKSLGIISSLFVAAGFGSIVLGLAAQSSLSNIISGLINSVSQPFRIGDSLSFRDDFCVVEDMHLIHTTLRTWDNRRMVVPNSIMQNEVIINYSLHDPWVLVPVQIQVGYESNISKAMQIMNDVARSHPDFMPSGDLPKTVVMELQDSGILLRLLSRAKNQSTAFGMTRDLLLKIKLEFDEQGIEIPYPKRQLILEKEVSDKLSRLEEI